MPNHISNGVWTGKFLPIFEEIFNCDQCMYQASTMFNLKRYPMKHNKAIWPPCEFCEFQCATESSLQSHKDHKHLDSNYPCPWRQCEFVAKSKQILKVHKNKNHLGISYKCDYCDYSNSYRQTLIDHMISKHTNITFSVLTVPTHPNGLQISRTTPRDRYL